MSEAISTTTTTPPHGNRVLRAVDRLDDARRGVGLLIHACGPEGEIDHDQLTWALAHVRDEIDAARDALDAELDARRSADGTKAEACRLG
jgi:hypothetical protein